MKYRCLFKYIQQWLLYYEIDISYINHPCRYRLELRRINAYGVHPLISWTISSGGRESTELVREATGKTPEASTGTAAYTCIMVNPILDLLLPPVLFELRFHAYT
jgi:hypothetical protein